MSPLSSSHLESVVIQSFFWPYFSVLLFIISTPKFSSSCLFLKVKTQSPSYVVLSPLDLSRLRPSETSAGRGSAPSLSCTGCLPISVCVHCSCHILRSRSGGLKQLHANHLTRQDFLPLIKNNVVVAFRSVLCMISQFHHHLCFLLVHCLHYYSV